MLCTLTPNFSADDLNDSINIESIDKPRWLLCRIVFKTAFGKRIKLKCCLVTKNLPFLNCLQTLLN